ncbi:MAG: sulfite exporter TauE/SafE family protein [Pseudomonadota bacterium]
MAVLGFVRTNLKASLRPCLARQRATLSGQLARAGDRAVTARYRAAGLGLLAGLLNGLVALGGGVLITPVLVARGITPEVAVGTSLAVVTLLSSVGFVAHSLFGGLVLGPVPIALSVVGGVVGSLIGSRLLARLTPQWMLLLFALFQALVAVRLIGQGIGIGGLEAGVVMAPPYWAYMMFGVMAGTLSGIFGVGGGALVLLGLAAFYGLPVGEGLAIALALNVTNALAGLIQHAGAGRVLWAEVRVLLPTAVMGIAAGAILAQSLPADAMRILFGAFFLCLGALIGRKGWRLLRSAKS